VSGSPYFSSSAAKEATVSTDDACCYHMTKKFWPSMDKVHAALLEEQKTTA